MPRRHSEHYEVWLQAEGRDRDDRDYAAACLLCRHPGGQPVWLTEYAGSRAEAWAIARKHHAETHPEVAW